MPPVIAAIAGFLTAVGFSAATAAVLAPMLLSLGASLVLGEISKLFIKGPSSSSLTSQLASRTVTTRQPVAPWRVMYGANRVGGIITFLHTTGAKNEKLHIVITLAGHEVNAISAMYFDSVAVPLDGSGNATGNFAGFVHAEFNLGTRAQAAFPGLLAAAPTFWDATHRQRNRAGVYVQLTWDVTKFPNGVPNVTFDAQGRKVYDPRGTSVQSDSFTRADENPLTTATWTVPTGGTALQLVATQCQASALSTTWDGEFYAGTFANDQFSQATLIACSGVGLVGVLARCAAGALTYYHADLGPIGAGNVRLWKRIAGTFTQIGSSVALTVSSGDILRLEAKGTTLTVFVNGVAQITQTDSAIAAGNPGLTINNNTASLANAILDNWSGGNLGPAQVYSNNAALCIADYLNNASFGLVAQTKYPVAAAMLTNSGLSFFSAANCVDGSTAAGDTAWECNTATAGSTLTIDLGASNAQEFRRCRLFCGDGGSGQPASIAQYRVQFSDDNSTWFDSLASPYLTPDVLGWTEVELAPQGAHRYWRLLLVATVTEGCDIRELEFYTSDVDSTLLTAAANSCDEQVALLAGGTQNRFSIDGSFDSSEAPSAVIGRMNSAMAGSVLYSGGKWGIFPGIWRAPTISLSDADFRGPMTVQTRLTHRDLFNGVKGTFISPTNDWQIADYPPFQSAAYLQEDNNEALWLDVELPFTINGAMAQRLSKIALRRVRHQITVRGQFKLTAYQVQPLDVLQLSHPRFGWVNKTFEVKTCTLTYAPDANGAPALGVDLTLREVDSTIYDWSTADEIAITAATSPTLPQNAIAQPPTSLSVGTIEIVRAADGVRNSFVGLTWTAPADQFVTSGGHIRVQYKKHTDSLWTDGGKLDGAATSGQVGPVIDGTSYDVQLWAENASGAKSTLLSATLTPTGTAVTIDTISDGSTYARTVASDQTSNRIDFSKSLLNKQLDNIPDGSTYNRVKGSEIISGTVKQINDGTNTRTAGAAAAAMDTAGNLLLKNINTVGGTTSSPTTTSSTFAVVAEMTQTIAFKGNKVLILFSGNFSFTGVSGSCYGQFALFKDGVQLSQTYEFGTSQTTSNNPEIVTTVHAIDQPSAGSHTYDIRWASKNGFTLTNLGTARTFQIVELG